HLPVQSGSTRILKLMKRSYDRGRYLDKIEMARTAVPGIAVTTDIIVGFPGETEEDFEQTLSLVEEVEYDSAYTFQYSPRAGTVAATMQEQVPKHVVQERFERLLKVQEAISLRKNQQMLGTNVEVLVEGPSRKDPSKVSGRTRTNKLVHVPSEAPQGTFVEARITSASPHHLEGISVEASPGLTAGPLQGSALG
ncbi:MAG: radical SAM protein, partial [Actinomycetota bacterium]